MFRSKTLFVAPLILLFTVVSSAGEGHGEEGVTISGGVDAQVIVFSEDDGAGGTTNGSDVVLGTVEIGISAKINAWTEAHILLLHEDDDTEGPVVDEGIITIANSEFSPFFLTGGRMHPFGVFESNLLSFPLTLELGDAVEAAIQLGFDAGIQGSVYLFNGTTVEANTEDSSIPRHFGGTLGYVMEQGDSTIEIGGGIISSIADTEIFGEALEALVNEDGDIVLQNYVPGSNVYVIYNKDPIAFFGEIVSATDAFDPGELETSEGSGIGAQPTATNLELGYAFNLSGYSATFSLALQSTTDAELLGLPETRTLVGLAVDLVEGTTLAVELAKDTNYDTSTAQTITFSAATEF